MFAGLTYAGVPGGTMAVPVVRTSGMNKIGVCQLTGLSVMRLSSGATYVGTPWDNKAFAGNYLTPTGHVRNVDGCNNDTLVSSPGASSSGSTCGGGGGSRHVATDDDEHPKDCRCKDCKHPKDCRCDKCPAGASGSGAGMLGAPTHWGAACAGEEHGVRMVVGMPVPLGMLGAPAHWRAVYAGKEHGVPVFGPPTRVLGSAPTVPRERVLGSAPTVPRDPIDVQKPSVNSELGSHLRGGR